MARRLLLEIIVMIFISIQPFAKRKLLAFALALLCLSTASCFADALYLSSNGRAVPQRQATAARVASLSPQEPSGSQQVPLSFVRAMIAGNQFASRYTWLMWGSSVSANQIFGEVIGQPHLGM